MMLTGHLGKGHINGHQEQGGGRRGFFSLAEQATHCVSGAAFHLLVFSLLPFRPHWRVALLKLDVNHIRMTADGAIFDVLLIRSG